MARSVDDLVLALWLIAGPDGQHLEIPPVALESLPAVSLPSLRLAWADDLGGVPVTSDTRGALTNVTSILEGLGCRVERCMPRGFDAIAAWETWAELWQGGVGSTMSPEEEAASVAYVTPEMVAELPAYRALV